MKNKKIIMKLYITLSVMLSLFFYSCNKEKSDNKVTCDRSNYAYLENYNFGSLCNNSLCNSYQDIWKQIFMEKNGLTEDFFKKHIKLCDSQIDNWNSGESFTIRYKVNIDWAIALNSDQFIIKITEENTYPSLNLPRNTYLTKEQVLIAVNGQAFSSDIIKLLPSVKLKFNSMSEAINLLAKEANINTMCVNQIYIDRYTGRLKLETGAQYEDEFNKCIRADLDLINGDISMVDTPCYID